MTYPKRGEISEDGKFYTHTDGSVYARTTCPFNVRPQCVSCREPSQCTWLTIIEGAYVPSAEEQEACDMARAMIVKCGGPESTRCLYYGGGYLCDDITNKSCPARAYLAAHGDANAWETK